MDAEQNFESKELEHLANIENELEEIKRRTPTGWRALLNGILSGGGAIIGGVLAVILIGWILAFFGIIPGLNHIAALRRMSSGACVNTMARDQRAAHAARSIRARAGRYGFYIPSASVRGRMRKSGSTR